MAFFASPAKPWLIRKLNARQRDAKMRQQQQRRQQMQQEQVLPLEQKGEHPIMGGGLPSDPGKELDDAVREIREEVEARRKRGASVTMPRGQDLKGAVEEKLGRKL